MLYYVTTNPGKIREARQYLGDETITDYDYDYPEIQSESMKAIAAEGARDAYRKLGEPVVVDDSGLFVNGLEGFPGPYSSYVEEKLGIERVWNLVEPLDDRTASFRCVMAYCDGDPFEASPDPVDKDDRAAAAASAGESLEEDEPLAVKLFVGTVRGEIVAPRGDGGFGFDPIFEHDDSTFAELTSEEKNALSHRGRALAKFAEWYETKDS